MAKKGTSQSVDLLIVLDENDNIRKWANEVKAEFQFLKKPLRIHICLIQDLETVSDAIKCKKVALFTHKSTHSLQQRVRDWIEKLAKADKTDDYLIINIQAKNEAAEAVEGIKMEQVVNVIDLGNVSLWWPKLLQLCFGRKNPKKKMFFAWNLSIENSEASRLFDHFEVHALESIEQTYDMEEANCIILVAENGKPVIYDEFSDQVREAKVKKVPVHFVMCRGEETSEDMDWIATFVHTPSRPLRAIFWIFNDLGLVKVTFTDRPKPKKVPKPCKPFEWITGGDDWALLYWSTKEPDDVGDEAIKCFSVESRIAKACSTTEWVLLQRVLYDGSGSTTIKIEGLHSDLEYQFRISSENVNGRSKYVITSTMTPGSINFTENEATILLAACVGCYVGCRILLIIFKLVTYCL